MSIKSRLFTGTLAATVLGVAPLVWGEEAQVMSHSKDIVVVLPASLPELARHGIAFQLYSGSGDGSCYLYIEQHQGEGLLVLNVTDPGHVILTKAVPLTVPGPFDFVRMVGTSAYLVRFRDGLGMGVLDLRKPKAPVLKMVNNLQVPGPTESLGDTAFLTVSGLPTGVSAISQDYQVVDTSNPAYPSLLFTVKQVSGEIARDETGTTFLLGADGLTIIRRPCVEEQYKMAQSYTN
jgi:hypothetical protein